VLITFPLELSALTGIRVLQREDRDKEQNVPRYRGLHLNYTLAHWKHTTRQVASAKLSVTWDLGHAFTSKSKGDVTRGVARVKHVKAERNGIYASITLQIC
jgi:hypothetical protein